MENWKSRYASKLVSSEQAASLVKNGDRIFLGSMCSEPSSVMAALEASYLEDLEFIQFITGHKAAELAGKYSDRFKIKTFFLGGAAFHNEAPSEADYLPLFHSQIGGFFRNRRIPIDVAIVQVSEPDRFGRLSLGISVDIAMAAVESTRRVIAQVNPRMPQTNGDTFIPIEKVNYLVEGEEELHELPEEVLGVREQTISAYVSELIEDGSVLQFGFAGISRGLMDFLKNHRYLGLHTEIFTDPLIDLIEAGVVDNSTKKIYRGKSLASCAWERVASMTTWTRILSSSCTLRTGCSTRRLSPRTTKWWPSIWPFRWISAGRYGREALPGPLLKAPVAITTS